MGDVVEKVAVVADDEDRRGAALQIVGEPQHPFEVEVVGRLVEQQQVRLGKEHRGERHAHAPAAGIFGKRPALRRLVEAQPFEDSRRPRRRRMGVDVDEASLDFGDALRVNRDFRFGVQRLAFNVGREHEVDEAFRPSRRLLLDAADARALGRKDRAALRRKFAANEAEERGLAGAVAPDEPDPRARGQRRAGAVDQQTFAEPIGKAVDVEHGALLARRARAGKIERALRVRLTGPTARRPLGKSLTAPAPLSGR